MKDSRTIVPLIVAMTWLAGCGGMTKPYPQKSLHVIEPGAASPISGQPIAATLRVDRVRIAQPFDGTTFVYRVGDSKFTTDYYSGFIASPSRILTSALSGWISDSRAFTRVLPEDSAAEHQLTLETNVTGLYGDYTTKGKSQAIIEARFLLINEAQGGYDVLFEKSYRESEAISAETPDALIKGWEAACQRMFTQLVTDLRAAKPPKK